MALRLTEAIAAPKCEGCMSDCWVYFDCRDGLRCRECALESSRRELSELTGWRGYMPQIVAGCIVLATAVAVLAGNVG